MNYANAGGAIVDAAQLSRKVIRETDHSKNSGSHRSNWLGNLLHR